MSYNKHHVDQSYNFSNNVLGHLSSLASYMSLKKIVPISPTSLTDLIEGTCLDITMVIVEKDENAVGLEKI